MNQLKEICKIIDVIQDETIRLEMKRSRIKDIKKESVKQKTDLFDYFLPRTLDVIAAYEHKYKCTNYQARNAFKDAVSASEGYVSTYNSEYEEMPDKPFDKYVEVSPAGRSLNSRIFKIIPNGRYNKWLGDNNNFVNFVFGTLTGILLTAAALVIKAIFKI